MKAFANDFHECLRHSWNHWRTIFIHVKPYIISYLLFLSKYTLSVLRRIQKIDKYLYIVYYHRVTITLVTNKHNIRWNNFLVTHYTLNILDLEEFNLSSTFMPLGLQEFTFALTPFTSILNYTGPTLPCSATPKAGWYDLGLVDW